MIVVDSLSRTYGSTAVLDDVSFTARPGRVTGLVGAQGAGKSTLMRVAVGLTHATSGTVAVCGVRYADLPNPGRLVGVLLDASAQHTGRTGRETLANAQRLLGAAKSRVEEVLDLVELTPATAARPVRQYSLATRQRLGVAAALIGEPEVLILDEPTTGLDPAGIQWMRDVLRDHADRGGTVLLSSHLVHEIAALADDLVVISAGRIVAHGARRDLLPLAGAGAEAEAVGRVTAAAGIPLIELRRAYPSDPETGFLDLTPSAHPDGTSVAPPESRQA